MVIESGVETQYFGLKLPSISGGESQSEVTDASKHIRIDVSVSGTIS